MNYTKLKYCRVCKNHDFTLAFDAGNQFLTGRFPRTVSEKITSGPLQMVACSSCHLVQLGHHYDLEEMYGDTYGYRSGLNLSMINHLQDNVDWILSNSNLDKNDLIIDIGSNDGSLLGMYKENQYDLVGVDPSALKFKDYYRKDIKIIGNFFNKEVLANILGDKKKAKIVTSFSMFYDLEDPIQFAKDVEWILDDEGIWYLEQSYLPTMLETRSFDTICHEHLEYYTVDSISNILLKAGLKIQDIKFNDTNGGSILISACKKLSDLPSNTTHISSILEKEADMGLRDGSAFIKFKNEVDVEKEKLLNFLYDCKKNNKRVCALGASTKGNVLLQYYGITKDLIECIGEVNEDKFGCFTPGTHIPIIDQKDLLASNPDYLIVLPWHFRDFFVSLPVFKERSLVFPLPEFEVKIV